MDNLFKSEEHAIEWVKLHIPFAIRATKKAKTVCINPFSSKNAMKVVTDELGKQLYKYQEQSKEDL